MTDGTAGAPGRIDAQERHAVTVRFFGGELVPGLPRQLTVAVVSLITAGDVIRLAGEQLGMPDLRAKIEKFYAVLVNGTSVQHLQGWDTPVPAGSTVSVVAPMGGGTARPEGSD